MSAKHNLTIARHCIPNSTVFSAVPTASVSSSALKATLRGQIASTGSMCSLSAVSIFHSRTVPSLLPLARAASVLLKVKLGLRRCEFECNHLKTRNGVPQTHGGILTSAASSTPSGTEREGVYRPGMTRQCMLACARDGITDEDGMLPVPKIRSLRWQRGAVQADCYRIYISVCPVSVIVVSPVERSISLMEPRISRMANMSPSPLKPARKMKSSSMAVLPELRAPTVRR